MAKIARLVADPHADETDALRARVAKLEEVIQTQNGVVVSGTLKLNEARARVTKLEAALKAFTEMEPGGNYRDDVTHTIWVSAGKFREARAALKDAPQ